MWLETWKQYVTKFDSNFGLFILTIKCLKCGHARKTQPLDFARFWKIPPETPFEAVTPRMRCSQCQAKGQVEWRVDREPRPRGRAFH